MAASARSGKDLRKQVPRSSHAEFTADGRDVVEIIREQNATRIQELVPVRMSRMLHSPFTFYRGGAAFMAHDLATATPNIGAHVMSCGDAHIANFGLFASPERRQLFDVNDFDEAGFAPWEWDVKRMATSVMIAARDNGYTDDQGQAATASAVAGYRQTLRSLMDRSAIERYYLSVDIDALTAAASDDQPMQALIEKTAKQARKRTSARVVEKITARSDDGDLTIVPDPPTLIPAKPELIRDFEGSFERYIASLRADAAALMSQYTVLDWALRVVGVGSVGTRCFIVLLGRDDGDGGTETLFLQVKEASESVLATYGGLGASVLPPRPPSTGVQGWRVVAGQQTMQAQSDPFLGFVPTSHGKDFYWRQFRDMKGSVATEMLTLDQFQRYGLACGAVLARAHSQSPQADVVASYMGKGSGFEDAVSAFALAYADQNEKDYAAAQAAVKKGTLPCDEDGV